MGLFEKGIPFEEQIISNILEITRTYKQPYQMPCPSPLVGQWNGDSKKHKTSKKKQQRTRFPSGTWCCGGLGYLLKRAECHQQPGPLGCCCLFSLPLSSSRTGLTSGKYNFDAYTCKASCPMNQTLFFPGQGLNKWGEEREVGREGEPLWAWRQERQRSPGGSMETGSSVHSYLFFPGLCELPPSFKPRDTFLRDHRFLSLLAGTYWSSEPHLGTRLLYVWHRISGKWQEYVHSILG